MQHLHWGLSHAPHLLCICDDGQCTATQEARETDHTIDGIRALQGARCARPDPPCQFLARLSVMDLPLPSFWTGWMKTSVPTCCSRISEKMRGSVDMIVVAALSLAQKETQGWV